MKNLQELLTYLHANGIKLWLEEERLRVSAPQGTLTESVRTQLTAHKAELIELLQAHEREQIRPTTRTGKEPLAFAQQRLWFLQQMEKNGAYNMPAVLRLQGTLNHRVLQQTVETIVARHESLRTTFHEEAGEIYQRIAPLTAVAIPMTDLTTLPLAQQEAQAHQLAATELRRTFDLETGPLFRLLLIRYTPSGSGCEEGASSRFLQPGEGWGGGIEHLLIFNMHHIISDGVSIALLIDELTTLYCAGVQGVASKLPPLPVQYVDYVRWQRKWLQGKPLEAQRAYWQEKLTGAPPLLELPTDRSRPPLQSFRGGTVHFAVDGETTQKLRSFSQQQQATLFMTLLSAYALLLSRYSNQRDILIGTPIAGRTRTEVEHLIGLFVNTLVMRVDLTDPLTVTALVEQVRRTTLDALAHQDLPFERLIDLLQVERNLSYNPLFQVFFAMQTVDASTITLPDLTLTAVEMDDGLAKFDLSLMITETATGLDGALEYNSDLFDRSTAQRMATHLQTILRAMVDQPTTQVATLPLLTPMERKRLLVDWNDTFLPYPTGQCLHALFEAQVERTPDACALLDGANGTELSYRELNRRANQVAHRLQQLGITPDDLIGLCVERSANLLIGLLGILKAGAAYVPLDPAFPKARLDLMLADATPALLVTESYFADDFAHLTLPRLYLDSAGAEVGELADQATHNPISAVTPDNLAYVIYTSGSTGNPKGVELCHRSVVNFLWSMRQQPGLTAADRLLAVTTISFDIAVLELYLPLITGATVLLANTEMSADPTQLMALLPRATVMQATPATWRMLLLAGWRGQPDLRLFVGGEALPTNLAQQLLTCGRELWNLYGPTETTVWSSLYQVKEADWEDRMDRTVHSRIDDRGNSRSADRTSAGALDETSITIGRPIGNTQLYILDEHRQPQPVGVPGELYIGGSGLARGYRKLPELTAEKFLPNPFGRGLLYRTGDLVNYRPDGTIAYLGRLDNQVKIRGFRIELGEIERTLERHPQLRQAAVVAQQDEHGGKQLVAFFIPVADEPIAGEPIAGEPIAGKTMAGRAVHPEIAKAPAGDELRAFLRERLPDYMVPAAFVLLDALPLTPNGKVDRRALLQMEAPRVDLATRYVPPETPLEEELVAIWADVLNLDPAQIGTHHNFFDLGGHSLLAIQVLSRTRSAFQVELPIRDLMDNPTIAGIAAAIAPMQQLTALFQPVPEVMDGERESIEL